MNNKDLINQLNIVEVALYRLNEKYGSFLTSGLEDKVDQLMNILEKERKSLENNNEEV